MRKPIALGVAFFFGVIVVGAGACSSSSTPNVPAGDASGSDVACSNCNSGETSVVDAGPDPACFDPTAVLSFSVAPLAPAANQGKCASDDVLTQFVNACLVVGTDPDAGDSGVDACTAFIEANPGCALCLGGFSPPDAGAAPASPWPALTPIDTAGHDIPSVAACIAAISTGTDSCKLNFANDDLCTRSGCAACAGSDVTACDKSETTDPTSTCLTTNPLDSTCTSALNAAQPDADAKCGASTQVVTTADFVAVFMKVGKTLCE